MKSKILTTALICLLISFAAGTSAFAQDSAAVGQYYEMQVENVAGDVPESLTIEETAKNLPEDATEVGEAAEKPEEEKTDAEEPEADRKQAEASDEYSSAENQQKETSGGSKEEIAYEQEGNNTQHAYTPDVQDDTSNADDPFLEGDYQETAGHTDRAGNEIPSGNADVEILKYSYERVTTNEKYCSLSFQFTNNADNKVYEAFITGINIVPVDGKTLDDVVVPLLTDMAKSFCSQTEFWLYDNDTDDFIKKYNLHVASIDAEKQDQTRATGTNSDSLLCWAASASNMLEFTGWGSVVDTETAPGVTEQKFADEDDILQYFEESFTDEGLSARAGAEWFFNGINDRQKVVDGKVQYTDDITVDPSQQKSDEAAHCGNLIQYAADEVVSSFWFKQSGFLPSLYDAAMGLKNGSGVGLSITWYDKTTGKFKSGHAITMFGYIKDTSVDGPESLVGIFTTDSDDNKYQDENRKNIVNRIRMNCLSDFSFTEKSEVFESKVMVGYSSSEQSVTVIKRFAILEAYQKDMPEDKGTKNAITTPDYTVRWINITGEDKKTVNSVDVGDLVNLLVITQNSSYANIDLTTYPSAYISGEFVIYKNDKIFDSVSFSNYLSNAGRYPLGKYSIRTVYSFAEKGNYQVSANISGIYYTGKEESTVQLIEAFFNNNISRLRYSITVNGEDPVPSSPGGGSGKSTGIDTYSAVFKVSEKGTYEITIRGSSKNIASIICDNFKLDSIMWNASDNSDGTMTISFDKDFISGLVPGSYLMKVLNAEGDIIAVLDVEILDVETM